MKLCYGLWITHHKFLHKCKENVKMDSFQCLKLILLICLDVLHFDTTVVVLLDITLTKLEKSLRGALECNLTGRCPFFKNLYNPFRKKIAFRYPVSELLDYKKLQKQWGNNSLLSLKATAFCS